MSGLAEIAEVSGLKTKAGPAGELRGQCEPEVFSSTAVEVAKRALLSDLFATVTGDKRALTAIFQTPGDRAWLLLTTHLDPYEFTSLTPDIHAASWYEREIQEMFGIEPKGHPAPFRLRLHEDWPDGIYPMRSEMPRRVGLPGLEGDGIPTVQGQGVFQLPLGPVRSGPQESAEFLFNSGGEDLVMVAPRFGFKFRAIERLAEGKSADSALILAERLAGISTFSNALAFTQAVERACDIEPPPAAQHARSLLNELERLHHHFGHIGRVADSTGLTVAAAQYAALKEEVLRSCGELTGHRYMRNSLAIGGLSAPLTESGLAHLRAKVAGWRARSTRLERLLEDTATFVDRLETTAVIKTDYAAHHNLVGPIGRSTGADRDVRRDHPYASYQGLQFEILVKSQGDALARVRVVLFEVIQTLDLLKQLLEHWPATETRINAHLKAGSALGWCEAPGGECLHFVELDSQGRVVRWRARPPACVNWHPYANACASGNNLTDYPVIEASFGLSHAEFDR